MPPSAKQTLFWIIPLPVAPPPAGGASCLASTLKRILKTALTDILPNILKSLGFVTPEVIRDFIREMAGHGMPKMDLTDRCTDPLRLLVSPKFLGSFPMAVHLAI